MRTLFLALGLFLIGASSLWAQDDVDHRKEKRLHRIYEAYNSKPTPDEAWQEALGGVEEQTYTLQSGDTLWDISETFFGDPDFWPKIWSLNGDGIFNPHEITPGDAIAFTPGSITEPPVIGDKKEEPPPDRLHEFVPSMTMPAERLEIDVTQLPKLAPTMRAGKNGAAVPGSLPSWSLRDEKFGKGVVEELAPLNRAVATDVTLSHFIQEGELQGLGEIVEAEAGMKFAHENQYVAVRLKGAVAGQKYLVARDIGALKTKNRDHEGSIVEIGVGAQLIAGEWQRVSVAAGGGESEANSVILGGAGSRERKIFGPGEILFLDNTRGANLGTGQVLRVYRVESVRDEDSEQKENPRAIGSVRVVQTNGAFATALVLTATEELEVGDSTSRAPQVE